MADALDLKSNEGNLVRVRFPPSAFEAKMETKDYLVIDASTSICTAMIILDNLIKTNGIKEDNQITENDYPGGALITLNRILKQGHDKIQKAVKLIEENDKMSSK